MIFQLSIMEKMDGFFSGMTHIVPRCAMHFHGHWNKVVPLMKLYLFIDLNNGIKFWSCICWSTSDTQNHRFFTLG